MEISEEDARVISRAFIQVNKILAGELERILNADAPDYLKEAAVKQYNADVKAYTELHVKLAEHFPSLTQP
jgi:hypothetical protein